MYTLKVTGGSPYMNSPTIMEFTAVDYVEFKNRFLKRFGNISGTNKASKEKQSIKDKIKESTCINEFKDIFFYSNYWHLEIKKTN